MVTQQFFWQRGSCSLEPQSHVIITHNALRLVAWTPVCPSGSELLSISVAEGLNRLSGSGLRTWPGAWSYTWVPGKVMHCHGPGSPPNPPAGWGTEALRDSIKGVEADKGCGGNGPSGETFHERHFLSTVKSPGKTRLVSAALSHGTSRKRNSTVMWLWDIAK